MTTRTVDKRTRGMTTAEVAQQLSEVSPHFRETFLERTVALQAAETIRQLRREKGLTQVEVADLAGMSQAQVSQLESGGGEQGPTVSTLERYAQALGYHLVLQAVPIESGEK